MQSPSASDISGFGTGATEPDDESRLVTKLEFTKLRHRVEKTFQRMYADVMGLIQKEVDEQNRQRATLKGMMVGRMETLAPIGKGPRDGGDHDGPNADPNPK